MINPKIERFLEENNLNYLYLLLSNLECERLNNLPFSLKKKFEKKMTETALEHVAINSIPDFIIEEDIEEDTELS